MGRIPTHLVRALLLRLRQVRERHPASSSKPSSPCMLTSSVQPPLLPVSLPLPLLFSWLLAHVSVCLLLKAKTMQFRVQ